MQAQSIPAAETGYIYIVFSAAHTGTGRLIRVVTRNKYSHVSLSFHSDLRRMYSFSRYNVNVPFSGGFVEESALRYQTQDGQPTGVKVCRIPIGEKSQQIARYIAEIQRNSDKYIYNIFSAMLVPLHKRVRIPQSYTCIEFVIDLLGQFQVEDGIVEQQFYRIADLEQLLADYVIYEGALESVAQPDGWGNDPYLSAKSPIKICTCTAKSIGRLVYRAVHT